MPLALLPSSLRRPEDSERVSSQAEFISGINILLLSNQTNIVSAIIAVAGALTTLSSAALGEPAIATSDSDQSGTPEKGAAKTADLAGDVRPTSFDETCFAETVCRLKEKLRWQKPAWDANFCRDIAHSFVEAADEFELNPALLLAIAINESDLDEKAESPTVRGDSVYAKDGGLMGIRCILDKKGSCTNGHVKGRTWSSIMSPQENIEIGARELAHYRDGGGIERVEKRVRGRDGKISRVVHKNHCRHKTHAYWAHYNHGPIYRTEGYARHYPHRVAVVYYALLKTLGLPIAAELKGRLTVSDKGMRQRTADHPVEQRFKHLVEVIENAPRSCSSLATLN
jgi:hypothetical protein